MARVYQSVKLKGLPAVRAKIKMRQSTGERPKIKAKINDKA